MSCVGDDCFVIPQRAGVDKGKELLFKGFDSSVVFCRKKEESCR